MRSGVNLHNYADFGTFSSVLRTPYVRIWRMRKRKTWEELTLKEHFMFARVMQNPTLCRRFLSCIHGRAIGELAFTPQTKKNY